MAINEAQAKRAAALEMKRGNTAKAKSILEPFSNSGADIESPTTSSDNIVSDEQINAGRELNEMYKSGQIDQTELQKRANALAGISNTQIPEQQKNTTPTTNTSQSQENRSNLLEAQREAGLTPRDMAIKGVEDVRIEDIVPKFGYETTMAERQQRNQQIAEGLFGQNKTLDEEKIFSEIQTLAPDVTEGEIMNTVRDIRDRFSRLRRLDELGTVDSNTIASWVTRGELNMNDISGLKDTDPTKYEEITGILTENNKLTEYNSVLSDMSTLYGDGEATEDISLMDQIKTNFMEGFLVDSATSGTDFIDEYQNALNDPDLLENKDKISDLEGEIKELDLQLNDLKREVEDEFGSSASKSLINSVVADRGANLIRQKNSLSIEAQTQVSRYNSKMNTITENFNLKLKEREMQIQERNQKMSELGFAMDLMNFETIEQQDERERQKFIREQDFMTGNINSSDPRIRQKAVETAVDKILTEFQGIPMVRSRDEMVGDIQRMVDSGMDLGTAITENIRKPIMDKPEYKKVMSDKFGIKYDEAVINIGGKDYIQRTNPDGSLSFEQFIGEGNSIKTGKYTYNQIDVGGGQTVGVGGTVNLSGQDYRITQLGGSVTGGVDLAFPKAGTRGEIGAFEGGQVIRHGEDRSTGNKYIEVLNDNGYVYRYNHLDRIGDGYKTPDIGSRIEKGDIVGKMGDTGKSTGVHLDLGVYSSERAGSMSVSPLDIKEQTRILLGGTDTQGDESEGQKDAILSAVRTKNLTNTIRDKYRQQALDEGWINEFIEAESTQYDSESIISMKKDLTKGGGYTDMQDISRGYATINGIYSNGVENAEGMADISAVNALQRMIDPGATVKEGDVVLVETAIPIFKRIAPGYKREQLNKGSKLPPATRQKLIETANSIYKAQATSYNDKIRKLRGGNFEKAGSTLEDEGLLFDIGQTQSKTQTDPTQYFGNLINTSTSSSSNQNNSISFILGY